MASEKPIRGFGERLAIALSQAMSPGIQLAEVMATSRPPSGSIENAERTCRRSAPGRDRKTPGVAENGGFIKTTVGRGPGRWSAIASALWRVTVAFGNNPASRPARVEEISFKCKFPAPVFWAQAAKTASMPVPAEGSSTTSPKRTPAARIAA